LERWLQFVERTRPACPFGVSPNGKELRSARWDAGRGNRGPSGRAIRAPQTATVVTFL